MHRVFAFVFRFGLVVGRIVAVRVPTARMSRKAPAPSFCFVFRFCFQFRFTLSSRQSRGTLFPRRRGVCFQTHLAEQRSSESRRRASESKRATSSLLIRCR